MDVQLIIDGGETMQIVPAHHLILLMVFPGQRILKPETDLEEQHIFTV